MIVVSFEGFTPPARFDASAQPWTQVRIEESSSATGTFSVIDTLALSPADTAPSSPADRSFTTTHATQAAGWYRLTFLDAAGNTSSPTAPFENAADPTAAIKPSLEQVATKALARTRVSGQRVLGTFSPAAADPADRTAVTAEQVQAFIDAGAARVHAAVAALSTEQLVLAKDVVAEYAAMEIEVAVAPETPNPDDINAYAMRQRAYEDGLALLRGGS
jgi:ribosomal protein S16